MSNFHEVKNTKCDSSKFGNTNSDVDKNTKRDNTKCDNNCTKCTKYNDAIPNLNETMM